MKKEEEKKGGIIVSVCSGDWISSLMGCSIFVRDNIQIFAQGLEGERIQQA